MKDDLIHIVDNVATPTAYTLTIKEFQGLTPEELGFIYFMVDYKSPFAIYEWDQRIIEVKTSIFGEKKKWTPSSKVKTGCEKYEDLLETSAVR